MANFCQRGLKPLSSYTLDCTVFLCISNFDQTKLCNSQSSLDDFFFCLSSFCIISVFRPVVCGHHCGSIQLTCRVTLRKVKKMVKNARQVSFFRVLIFPSFPVSIALFLFLFVRVFSRRLLSLLFSSYLNIYICNISPSLSDVKGQLGG